MSLSLKKLTLGLMAITLLLGSLSCSNQQTATVDAPEYFSDEAIKAVRDHTNKGYEYLDADNLDSAVAEFAKITSQITTGVVAEYHTACAYGRTGDKDKAFASLTELVNNGYASVDDLENDGDLASLVDDPRFEQIIATAKANLDGAVQQVVDGGIPEYETAPETFATVEEFDEWYKKENGRLRSHRGMWPLAVSSAAKFDLIARKLAIERELKADDPEFEYGLERVKAAATISSMYESWGPVADIVLAEAATYIGNSPSEAGSDEANYRCGLALSMKYQADDDQRVAAYSQADSYLDKIADGSDFYAPAQTLAVVNKLRLPDADRDALKPEFNRVVENYSDDKNAYRVISTQYGKEAVQLLWPIGIGVNDIDDKKVTIDQYKGKVLLIDFWATWCPPCRAELPNMLSTYEEYKSKGFDIVSISLDYSDDVPLADYRKWIDEKGMNWRHTYDGEGWKTGLVKEYFVSGIPAPFMVGPDGSLIAWGEDCRGDKLAETVKKALNL